MKLYMNLLLWATHIREEQFYLFDELKSMGYDGVEVPIFEGDATHYRNMGHAIKQAGLECSAVTCPGAENDPTSHDPQIRNEALDSLKWTIDMCTELGTEMLVGPFFAAHGNFDFVGSIDDCRMRSANVIKEVAQYAQTKKIDLSLEFLNRFETFLLNCTSDTAKYLKLVDEPNIGILYDTHHANIEEKSISAAFVEAGSQFNHIHLSESHRGTLGDGQVNWLETIHELKKLDYKGRFVIEAFAHDLPGFSEVAHVWRPLFSDKLELCRGSLRFVKRVY